MNTATGKLCCRCKKDVSATKRVKDAQGQYFCEACYQVAMKPQPASPLPKPAAATVPAGDEYDLLPTAEPPKPARPVQKTVAKTPTPAATPAPAGPKKLPDFCPACDAPVLPNRRICIKCQRDLTKMDKLIAMKAEGNKVSAEEKIGNLVGKTVKIALLFVVLGIAVFLVYGGWLMFHPPGAFDEYPTTRAEAVKEILENIAIGTDKSYEQAFILISMRERTTNNTHEDGLYKMVYTRMHDEFLKKYGPDWASKAKIENLTPGNNDEVVPFSVTINDDVYHVTTQAQISIEQSVANMTVRRDVPQYLENGKRHFGVLEIEEYTVHPKSTMEERAGPGKPESLPDLKDFHPNGQ